VLLAILVSKKASDGVQVQHLPRFSCFFSNSTKVSRIRYQKHEKAMARVDPGRHHSVCFAAQQLPFLLGHENKNNRFTAATHGWREWWWSTRM